MQVETIETLITGKIALTMQNQSSGIIKEPAIAIDKGIIKWVGDKGNAKKLFIPKDIMDFPDGLIMPGLINGHTHAAMTCFRGMADDLDLMTWLEKHIFPAERLMNKEIVYLASLLACAEMILGGTTTFCDMYLFEEEVAMAVKKTGMRAILGEGIFGFDSPSYGKIEKGLEWTKELIKKYQGDNLISFYVEPHSTYTCTPEILKACGKISMDMNVPMVIHLSETRSEVENIINRYGLTPVMYLKKLGLLNDNLIASHCVILNKEDMDALTHSGVTVIHNPESNMKLASGRAPVPEMIKKGITVGIGTDGCASNNDLDMFGEMDFCAKLHKLGEMDPTVMKAEEVVLMATAKCAKALKIDNKVGIIEPGKKADIIVIDLSRPHLTPIYNPASHIVYAVKSSDVIMTMVEGKVLMEKGDLKTIDIKEIKDKINFFAEKKFRSFAL